MTSTFDLSDIAPAASVSTFEIALECIALAHAIREVSIRSTDATLREVELVVHHVCMNPTVTVIDISRNHRLDHQAARALSDLANHKRNLTNVIFEDCGFVGSRSAATLLRLLERNRAALTPMYHDATSPHDEGGAVGTSAGARAWKRGGSLFPAAATPSQQANGSEANDGVYGVTTPTALVAANPALPPFAPPITLTRCSSSGAGGENSSSTTSSLFFPGGDDSGGLGGPGSHRDSLSPSPWLNMCACHARRLDHYVLRNVHRCLRIVTWVQPTMSAAVLAVCLVVIWLPFSTFLSTAVLLYIFGKRPRDELIAAAQEPSVSSPDRSSVTAVRGLVLDLVSPYKGATNALKETSTEQTPYMPLEQLQLRVDRLRRALRVASSQEDAQNAAIREAVSLVLNPFHEFVAPILRTMASEQTQERLNKHDGVLQTPPSTIPMSLSRTILLSAVRKSTPIQAALLTTGALCLSLWWSGPVAWTQWICTVLLVAVFSFDLWWDPLIRHLARCAVVQGETPQAAQLSPSRLLRQGGQEAAFNDSFLRPLPSVHRSRSSSGGHGTPRRAEATGRSDIAFDEDDPVASQLVEAVRASTRMQPLDHRYMMHVASAPAMGFHDEDATGERIRHNFATSPSRSSKLSSPHWVADAEGNVKRTIDDDAGATERWMHNSVTSRLQLEPAGRLHSPRALDPSMSSHMVSCNITRIVCHSRPHRTLITGKLLGTGSMEDARAPRTPPAVSVASTHTLRLCLWLWGVIPFRSSVCLRCDPPRLGSEAVALLWHKSDSEAPVAVTLPVGDNDFLVRGSLFDGSAAFNEDIAPDRGSPHHLIQAGWDTAAEDVPRLLYGCPPLATGTSPLARFSEEWTLLTTCVPLAVVPPQIADAHGVVLSTSVRHRALLEALEVLEVTVAVRCTPVAASATGAVGEAPSSVRRTTSKLESGGAVGTSSWHPPLLSKTSPSDSTESSMLGAERFAVLYRGSSNVQRRHV
jgi:hypothetical protein